MYVQPCWRACAADDSTLIAVLAAVQKEEMVHSIPPLPP